MHLPSQVDAAIFDIGNVVVTFDDERALRALKQLGMGGRDLQVADVFSGSKWRAFAQGKIPEEEFRRDIRILFEMGASVTDAQIDEAIGDVFTPIESTIDILCKLREQQVPLIALSNVEPPRDRMLARMGIWDHFDRTVKSCEAGMTKPDHGIYLRALAVANAARYRVLFVDDLPRNVLAAAELGIASHVYQDPEGLRKFLALHNITIV